VAPPRPGTPSAPVSLTRDHAARVLSHTEEDPTMLDARVTRRGVIAGLAAAFGALAARTAEAFSLRDRLRFRAASELLDELGVTVRADTAGHDVLVLDVVPRPGIQYDEIVRERTRPGEIVPCLRTSVFGGVEQFSLFDPDSGAIEPCYRTTRREGVVTSEHFHPRVSGVDPCLRTTVTDAEASVELLDLTDGDIVPCLRVLSQMRPDGALGPVELTVDPDEDLTVRVGADVYRLVDGKLVLDETRAG
jgi:hypothetical protein